MAIVPKSGAIGVALVIAIAVVVLWLALRLLVLRLHDINLSGKWILIVIVLGGVAGVLQKPGLIAILVWVPSLVPLFWPGTDGENDYGPPCDPNTTLVKVGAGVIIAIQFVGVISSFRNGRMLNSGFPRAGLEQSAPAQFR
jgi:hypothetical protein